MADEIKNSTLDNGLEHRIGAELHDWDYNDTIIKDDIGRNVLRCINSLYTTSIANQIADCNIKRVGGLMSDFKCDINANMFYGLSGRSYVLKYPIKNVFFFNQLFLHRLNRNTVVNGKHTGRKFFSNADVYKTPYKTQNGKESVLFSVNDTANRPDVFTHRLLMFIDGLLFTDLILYATPKYLLMVIDADRNGIDLERLMRLCDPNADYRWSLIGIPFSASRKRDTVDDKIQKSIIYGDSFIVTAFTKLIDYKVDNNFWLCAASCGLIDADFEVPDKTDPLGQLKTVRIVDNKSMMNFTFGSIFEQTISSNKHSLITVTGKNAVYGGIGTLNLAEMKKQKYTSAQLIHIPNVAALINLGTNRIFQYGCDEKHPSPIPPENMIVFKYNDETGYRLVHMYNEEYDANDITDHYGNILYERDKPKVIHHYFPNVYHLEGFRDGDMLKVLIFYGKHDKTTFSNPLEDYMNYNKNYANDIVAGILPSVITSYIPAKSTYKEYNYLKYHASASRNIEHEYKLETLREMVNDDYRRLLNIYLDHQIKVNNKYYANPKFTIDMALNEEKLDTDKTKLKPFVYTVSLTNGYETSYVCYKFNINHQENIHYPVTIWIDGVRLSSDSVWYEYKPFKTTVIFVADRVNHDSIITVEMFKIADNTAKELILNFPPIHNSVAIPRGCFSNICPQNMMYGIETDFVGENGKTVKMYKVASNYEVYWLLVGHTQYRDGVPINYSFLPDVAVVNSVDVIMDMSSNVLLQDDNVAVIADNEHQFAGDFSVLKTRGDVEYYQVKQTDATEDPTMPDQFITQPNLGYYGKDKKRFYEYMPYGKGDPTIFITPLTDYFKSETVLIKNTDVYFTKRFELICDKTGVVSSTLITIPNFDFDPSPNKFRLYLDGKLLDYGYDFTTDVYLDRGWYMGSDMHINIKCEFDIRTNHEVCFEYIPYKYRHLYRNIESDGNILLRYDFMRPFDLKFYDVYLDGKLLGEKDITVITSRRFTINQIAQEAMDTNITRPKHIVSIYERAHDADVIDYVWREEEVNIINPNDGSKKRVTVRKARSIENDINDRIINADPGFKKYMMPSWDKFIEQEESAIGLGVGKVEDPNK